MKRRRLWASALAAAALIACAGRTSKSASPRPAPASSARASLASATPTTRAPAAVHARPANAEELALIAELMRETERLRELRFVGPVRVDIEDMAAMRAYVETTLDPQRIERARTRYLALGAISADLDVRGALLEVLDEELVGYYDPKQKRLAVRAEIASAMSQPAARRERTAAWRATVVHELVHALQDQHFGIGARLDEERTTDADNAFGALVEGDATLVMLAYGAAGADRSVAELSADPDHLLSLMTRSPEQLSPALRRAPALLREPLLFRYRDGARYCAELHRLGGFARIDQQHRALPVSTRAIRAPSAPADIAVFSVLRGALDWLEEHGARVVDEDVLGALELSILLQDGALFSSWRDDRYVVVERQGTLGSLWWIAFATPAAARSAARAFRDLRDPARRVVRHGSRLFVSRSVTPHVFERAAATAHGQRTRAARPDRASSARRTSHNRADPLATSAREH